MAVAVPHRAHLPADLAALADYIEAVAREHGLDFDPVVFQLLDARDVNGVASYGGFPVRYPSWRFGMEYERLEKGYLWGVSKIYELVINNDPVYAYLVKSNSRLEQKLVMAHVFGHADFFKHNQWFQPTDRHMLDTMARHGARVRALIDQEGQEAIEAFLDVALCLDTLIDPYLPLQQHLRQASPGDPARGDPAAGESSSAVVQAPTYDVLGFLHEHAPLEPWKRLLLGIVREEAYYFQPQRMTKIMNEGWASYWHSKLLTERILGADEIVDFADCHSMATAQAPGQLNPYKIGIELFRHALRRGHDIFRLRRVHNDSSFVDELLDEEFVVAQQLFLYGRNPRSGRTEVLDRDWRPVKARILRDLSWGGMPQIQVQGVEGSERTLVLLHHHEGRDLQLQQAGETLRNVARIWQGPVRLRTREDDKLRGIQATEHEFELTEEGPVPPVAGVDEASS